MDGCRISMEFFQSKNSGFTKQFFGVKSWLLPATQKKTPIELVITVMLAIYYPRKGLLGEVPRIWNKPYQSPIHQLVILYPILYRNHHGSKPSHDFRTFLHPSRLRRCFPKPPRFKDGADGARSLESRRYTSLKDGIGIIYLYCTMIIVTLHYLFFAS